MPKQRNKPTQAAMCKLEPEHNAMMDTLAAFQDHAYAIGYQQALDDIGQRANIYVAIDKERSYQDRKYGTIAERKTTLRGYIEIIRDELHEAFMSLTDGNLDNARCELLQVAAVAVAALEAHGLVGAPKTKSNPMPDTITCTICGNELRTTLDQYGPPQAPLCLRHWNEYQDGKWTLSEKRTPIVKPGTPGTIRGYDAPMFDGYTYEIKETN